MPSLYDYNAMQNEDELRKAFARMNGQVRQDNAQGLNDLGFEQRMRQAYQRGQVTPGGVSMQDIANEQAAQQPIEPQFQQSAPAPIVGQGGGFFNVASDPVPQSAPAPVNFGGPTLEQMNNAKEQQLAVALKRLAAENAMRQRNVDMQRSVVAQQRAADGAQPFGVDGVRFTPGIPADAMRRANGTAVSYGTTPDGVKFVQAPNGRRIPMSDGRPAPQGPSVGEGIAMIGSEPVDLQSQAGQMRLMEALQSPRGRGPSQNDLLERSRRPDEAGMSLEEMMRTRRAASLEKQRQKDELAATAGQRRNDYRNEQIAKRSEAMAAGARSVEQARAEALAAGQQGRFGGGRRGIEITNEDRIARELERMTAAGLIKTPEEYWAARQKLMGMMGGGAVPPPVKAPEQKKNDTVAGNLSAAIQRTLGLRGAPPAPPPSAPWQPDLPPQGQFAGWGNWRGY